jgi:hypothetical protein
MAVLLSSQSSEHGFSISHLISRFRSKKKSKNLKEKRKDVPQDTRPPLTPALLPLVLPEHQASLAPLGWTTITFPDSTLPHEPPPNTSNAEIAPPVMAPHPLQTAYEDLFAASQAFFDLPDSEKSVWKHKLGSEEGWSKIPGEKEFITLRTLEYCPDILCVPAKRYWDLMGAHLSKTLGRISTSLSLPDDEDKGLRQFVGPCATMQALDTQKTSTMLRLFRYEGWEPKVVAEPHADLGLLSVVVGNVPGLEVWDGRGWFDVEVQVEQARKTGASMLVGRQLERMSNGRYGAGGHRVVSYGLPDNISGAAPKLSNLRNLVPSGSSGKRYRFSIVFVLRAHEPIVVESDTLETEITGKWTRPLNGETVGKMFEEIRGKHYNINIDVSEREKQRRKLKIEKGDS